MNFKVFVLLVFFPGFCFADADVYQKPSAFLKEVFKGKVPAAKVVDVSSRQEAITKLLGHKYGSKRIRYWAGGGRTVWILNEIGKTQPITTGYVVKNGKIAQVKVLIYRESHGWEVRKKFFTRQFTGAGLTKGTRLTKRIDNVAGATLSVRALTKMGKLALYLDSQTRK